MAMWQMLVPTGMIIEVILLTNDARICCRGQRTGAQGSAPNPSSSLLIPPSPPNRFIHKSDPPSFPLSPCLWGNMCQTPVNTDYTH